MAYSFSKINIYGVNYYSFLVKNKFEHKLLFYTERHMKDLGKEEGRNEFPLFDPFDRNFYANTDYLAEFVEFRNGVPKNAYNSQIFLSQIFMEEMNEAKSYGYTNDQIIVDDISREGKKFYVDIHKISPRYEYEENNFTLSFRTPKLEAKFSFQSKTFKYPKVDLKKIEEDALIKRIKNLNFNEFKFEHIQSLFDISWLDTKKYDYVDNNEDFLRKAFCPMVWEILDCKEKGEKALLGFDTEDTGLDFHYDRDDMYVDRLTTVQLSWKDHQGVIVYLGMDTMSNCSIDFVLTKLASLFKWRLKNTTCSIELKYDRDGNKLDIPYVAEFSRHDFLVGGHNHIFDGKVVRKYGYEMFFDVDTLTIANILSPNRVLFSRGLKGLIKRLLGIDMLELSELFGKGNEGMFHVLSDHRVAMAYGCADTDFFRLLYKEFMKFMSPRMHKTYHGVLAYIDNMISRSEYFGVRANRENINKMYHSIKEDMKILENLAHKHVGTFIEVTEASKEGRQLTLTEIERAKYIFKLKGDEARDVFYNKLHYPVEVVTPKGLPAVNTVAFDKLLTHTNDKPIEWLDDDIKSSDGERVLIKKDKFNSYKFPLAYLFKVYSDLLKDMNNYYKPFYKNKGERIFKQIKPIGTFTNRIGTPLQTIKKHIKKEIIAHEDDWACVNWDQAQVEARAFNSMGGDKLIIERFKNPEADTHIETAAIMLGIPPHEVTPEDRSKIKAIAFGIPYGLQDRKLCERLFKSITTDYLIKTRELRFQFEKTYVNAMTFLENARAKAYEPYDLPELHKKFLGITDDDVVVAVFDNAGMFRYKNVTDYINDSGRRASDARAFGNLPIQSYCSYIYKFMLMRMDMRIREDGNIDKFIPHVYVHDEIHCSYHKSLPISYLIKVFREECILRLKGHTNYFIGVSFGDNWLDCKSGKNELPVILLDRIANGQVDLGNDTYVDHPGEFLKPVINKYKRDRSIEIIKSIVGEDLNTTLDASYIIKNFTNYTVRNYLSEVSKPAYNARIIEVENKDKGVMEEVQDNNDVSLSLIINLLMEDGHNISIKDFDSDVVMEAKDFIDMRNSKFLTETVLEEIIDLDDEDNILEMFGDFIDLDNEQTAYDDNSLYEYYYDKYLIRDDYTEKMIDEVIENYVQEEDECEQISVMGNFYIIYPKSYSEQKRIISELNKYKSKDGKGKGVMINLEGKTETLPFLYDLPGKKLLSNILFNLDKNNTFNNSRKEA